ncbi:hypothetical protein JG688_00017598 [Phytophthora aleatoria]|uniref:Secreted RxLR effector peptide protein n=1 Tax=Phytophthora aleatoria TaxID=2496075 RepID=A0A8J5LYF6_9STRA|nr:hypothetical protein JG688_00017598 [Phytophthora aleatoria]
MMRLYSVALLVAAVLLATIERATSIELTIADYPTVLRSLADHQNGVAPKRLLRHYDEDYEERAIGGGTISVLATKLRGGASKLAEKLLEINKYEAHVAVKLDLGHIDNTLTGPNLQHLAERVERINSKNIIKKVSVIGTLTARYGDDRLATALVTAEKDATSNLLKEQLQQLRKDQLTRWVDGGKSADDVIKLLKICRNDPNFSQKLEVLDDFVRRVNPTNPDQTLLSTLIKGVPGEAELAAFLQTAKTHPRTITKATELETSLLSKWAGDGQLPANVFLWLKLYDNVDNAFTDDNLNKFVKYVDDFNLKEPINKKSALEIYTNSFKEADVAVKLESAINNPPTRRVAIELQTQQLKGWKSVDAVFTILGITTKDEAAITSRKLDVLVKFILSKSGEQNLIQTLTTKFRGRGMLATILESASTTEEATTLQKKQFASLVDNGVSSENFMSSVFKTLVGSATDVQKTIATKFKKFNQS